MTPVIRNTAAVAPKPTTCLAAELANGLPLSGRKQIRP